MKKILLISHNGGGGHQASVQALEAIIAKQGKAWQTEEINLYHDILGLPLPDGYNLLLKSGWTSLFWLTVPWFNQYKKLRYKVWLDKLQQYWQKQQEPNLVVSLIPFFNREIYHSLQQVYSEVPLVVLLTDLASDPPHFWLEAWQGESSLFVICPTARAMEQALQLGYPKTQLYQTSGVILHPRFYQPITSPVRPLLYEAKDQVFVGSANQPRFDLSRDRQRLGLASDLSTGVVSFGGQGAINMLDIAERLGKSSLSLQLIFLCGKNESLANQLRNHSYPYPHIVKGFTDYIPYYLSLADFFIGKPGPGSLSEAIALNLPIITICNSSTLWHERYNAQWIQQQKLGIILQNFGEINQAVSTLIQPHILAHYQASIKKIRNRAIFQVMDIFQKILNDN
jgi:1,2-diacylglycerol 3-beta-galactosyltransferase